MDEQKKQQMMIGAVVALVLGAGTYFVAFREGGGPTTSNVVVGELVRRQHQAKADENKNIRPKPHGTKTREKQLDTSRPVAGPKGTLTPVERKKPRRRGPIPKTPKRAPMG